VVGFVTVVVVLIFVVVTTLGTDTTTSGLNDWTYTTECFTGTNNTTNNIRFHFIYGIQSITSAYNNSQSGVFITAANVACPDDTWNTTSLTYVTSFIK
jgi:hypothetical protein